MNDPTCIHHTDVERAYPRCPVCLGRDLSAARAREQALRDGLEALLAAVETYWQADTPPQFVAEKLVTAKSMLASSPPPVIPVAVAEQLADHLAQALRQWEDYVDQLRGEDIETARHLEGVYYHSAKKALTAYRANHPKPTTTP